jgi:hypothetical protein
MIFGRSRSAAYLLVGGVSDGDRNSNVSTVADRVASYSTKFPDALG